MNWNMLGHEWAVDLLKEHVIRGQVRHAYLITGPQGVGRRTLALRLAQAVNCPQPVGPGEPCGICRTCRLIEQMRHPDLAVVQAEQRGGTLKVDQVRELQRSLSLAPFEAPFRIAMLLHFEESHISAANALLKTLEEPASRVILILTAESAEILLPTVVSRCEVLRLRTLPIEQLSSGLHENMGINPDQAQLLAAISNGRPGYAIYLDQHPEQMSFRRKWLDEQFRLLKAARVERFRFADAQTTTKDKSRAKDQDIPQGQGKENVRTFILIWLSLWRDVLLQTAGAAVPVVNQDYAVEIDRLAKSVSWEEAHQIMLALERTIKRIDQNINARLALEVLMLDLPLI